MSADFFKQDQQVTVFTTAEQLTQHLAIAHDLRDVLYQPDWPPDLRRVEDTTFKNVSFSKKEIRNVTFTRCIFRDCLFIGTGFTRVEFHSCKFQDCNFYKCKFSDVYLEPNALRFSAPIRRKYSNVGVHLFQNLFEDASRQRQVDFAMRADIQLRRWKRAQLRYNLNKEYITWAKYAWKWFASLAYELAAGFGYRPGRFILATLILFTIIATINWWALRGSLSQDGIIIEPMSWIDSMYFTYTLLTSVGAPSLHPVTTLARLIVVLEALFRIGWIAIFTSLLVKRVLR